MARLAEEKLRIQRRDLACVRQEAHWKVLISYNDAVEEALCLGWTDSIVKTLDEARSESDDMEAYGWVKLIDGKLALVGSDP